MPKMIFPDWTHEFDDRGQLIQSLNTKPIEGPPVDVALHDEAEKAKIDAALDAPFAEPQFPALRNAVWIADYKVSKKREKGFMSLLCKTYGRSIGWDLDIDLEELAANASVIDKTVHPNNPYPNKSIRKMAQSAINHVNRQREE